MSYLGIVKWFDDSKGFGVIISPEVGEVFLHKLNIQASLHSIKEKDSLIFDIALERGKTTAKEVRKPSSYEDLCFVFSYANKPNIIKETTTQIVWISNRRKRREPSIIERNIFHIAIEQFAKQLSSDEYILYFKRYFDENFLSTDSEEFIKFLHAFMSIWLTYEKKCFIRIDDSYNITNRIESENIERENEIYRNKSEECVNYFLNNIDKKLLFTVWEHKLDELPDMHIVPTENKSVFQFPEDIFLYNYSSLDFNKLGRIFKQPNGEQIITQILIKKIETTDSIKSYLYTIFGLIDKFENQENITRAKGAISNSILRFFKDRDIEESSNLKEFNDFSKELKRYYAANEFSSFIAEFNKTVSDDALFKLWAETKFFEPEIDFYNKNFARLNYQEFIKAPEELHRHYVKKRLEEIGSIHNVKDFALLILLLVEIPIKIGEEVLNELPLLYKVILSITFKKSDSKSKYFTTDYESADFKIDENKIIDFLKSLDTIDEFGYLLSVVINIRQKYQFTISSVNNDGFFKLSNAERIERIQKHLEKNGFNRHLFLRTLFENISNKYFVALTKIFVPKHITTDEVSSNGYRIFSDYLVGADVRIQKELFEYLGSIASKSDKVNLFLEGRIENIELNNVIEEFNSIAIEKQPILWRRLFFLIHSKRISSVDEFFQQILVLSSKSNININVAISIKVLESLRQNDHYIGENIISDVVCKYINEDAEDLIQINDLFEKCKGRIWITTRENETIWYLNIGGKNFRVNNDCISVGGYSYNFDRGTRTVSIDGKDYPFRWSREDSNIFERKREIPDGITFCDAQKSDFDETLKKQFYWCNNGRCYMPCQNDHLDFEWRHYTLRDFIKILDIPFNNDSYYKFIGVVNRANRLLEKLKCSSCMRLLRDSRTSEFAFYRVTTFHCTNPNCGEYHKVVYLNHCLNWRCLNVVDSRVSEKCPNGWYICDKCNSCCSQEKIERRYSNLLFNNAFNPSNPRHQKLKYQADNKLGHLEKGEEYDFKTGLPKTY